MKVTTLTCEECGADLSVTGLSPLELETQEDEDEEDEEEEEEPPLRRG